MVQQELPARPAPKIANTQAAGGNRLAQTVQAQPHTELSHCANYPVAEMEQQIATIQQTMDKIRAE